MTSQHPITPPPELVNQCWDELRNETQALDAAKAWGRAIALAYQAGADQELEAILELAGEPSLPERDRYFDGFTVASIREERRPKPPSLKEQALMALEDGDLGPGASLTPVEVCIIRRALEALPE